MKISARLILAYASLILISIFTEFSYAKIDPKSAVGIWLFDEGAGKVAKDSSENNNDGTLENSPKWAEGKLDKALEFNGKDNYVKVPDTESLDITDAITIVGWVYPNFYGQSNGKKPVAGDGSSVNIFGPLRGGIALLFGTGKGGQYGNYYNGKIDDVAIFHTVLAEKDIDNIMNKGLGRTLGITAVSPSGKLAAVWGSIKK